MVTINQLIRKGRKKKLKKVKLKSLNGNPLLKGVCSRVYTVNPKKPNSAIRKVAKIFLSNKKMIIASIPGQGHDLMQYSTVLVRGGRSPDLIGVKYKLVRGKYDFTMVEHIERSKARSKYGKRKSKL